MIVEVIAVGTELLLGQIVNTNATWLGSRIADEGWDAMHQQVVGDNRARLAEAIQVAMGRADAAFTANESFKDLAAVNVIIEAAGGQLSRIDGNPFLLGDYMEGQRIDGHLMVAGKSSIRPVLDCIRHQRT